MKQIMSSLVLALAVVAGGCGGSQKTSKAKGPGCGEAAASAEASWMAGPGGESKEAADFAPVLRGIIEERCVADAWAPATVTCMATSTGEAFEACSNQLTDEQKQHMIEAMQAKLPPDAFGAPAESAPPTDPCGGGE